MAKSKLDSFIKSLEKGEVLLPALRDFLTKEREQMDSGAISKKASVIEDAKLTVKCFNERISEFNHGEDPKGDYFHPSALGQCQRKMFYEIYSAPQDTHGASGDALLREFLIFETGTYIHVLLQNLCARAGLLVKRELPIVDKERRIIGHADGKLRINGRRYILEIKTINSVGYSKLDGPKHEHKAQAHAYMAALDVPRTVFVYFDKDKNTLKEYVVEFDQDFYDEHVEERIETFFKLVHGRKVPEREGMNPKAYPCMFCAYTRVCWETATSKVFEKQLRTAKNKHEAT